MNTTYYVTNKNGIYELRQTRYKHLATKYKGNGHPHDVCAVGRNVEEIKKMVEAYNLGTVDYSEVEA